MKPEDLHELLKQGESQTMSSIELKFSTDLTGTKWGPGSITANRSRKSQDDSF